MIRRPPLGELLRGAHDMGREWKLISALAPTAVPVPRPIAFCDDPSVTGAAFYVMGEAEGHALYGADDVRRWIPEEQRTPLARHFFDVLADLHALDPDAVGLGELGKREGYVGRQLATWYRSWTASVGPAELDDPRAHELHAWLSAHAPPQARVSVVHGDYGLHNCLAAGDRIAAVLDWEISTLGDPLADLAYALNRWSDPSDPPSARGEGPTSLPGFPGRAELAQRYAERTGADLSRLAYYVAFNRWKSAAIVHGVYARYREGKKSSEGVDLEGLRLDIDRSLALAEQALAGEEGRG